jgi:hypothetical protein
MGFHLLHIPPIHIKPLSGVEKRIVFNSFKTIGNQALDTTKRISKDMEKVYMAPVNMFERFGKSATTPYFMLGVVAVGGLIAVSIINKR